MPRRCRSIPVLFLLAACARRDAPAADTVRSAPAPATADAASAVGSGSNTESTAAGRWVVTTRGIGPIVAGLSLAALDTALSERLRPTYAPGASCAYVHPAALPNGVLVMMERDTVARVDVRSPGVLTADGAGVGDAEREVLKRYEGRVHVSPHKYTGPSGHYLTVSAPPDTAHLLVFETDGKTVVRYRAGRRPAVELVEGCS